MMIKGVETISTRPFVPKIFLRSFISEKSSSIRSLAEIISALDSQHIYDLLLTIKSTDNYMVREILIEFERMNKPTLKLQHDLSSNRPSIVDSSDNLFFNILRFEELKKNPLFMEFINRFKIEGVNP